MKPVPFVGPSYTLANRKADIQRSVNLILIRLEAAGKAQFILDSVPGLAGFSTLSGACRGGIAIDDRAFVVFAGSMYEVLSDGSLITRGSLSTTTGMVSMAYGITQLVIVDGGGYVLTLADNTFVTITDPDFPGADTVDFMDNFFVFSKDRQGQQFQLSAINDATMEDALDFASSESQPDPIVSHVVIQAGLLIFGTLTCELWVDTGAQDFPFERSRGSGFQVGLMARSTLKRLDNGCAWVGRDETGAGIVYRLNGGSPQRISTQAVEQAIQASTDLTQATAYAYQDNGLTFYAINAPGVASTWVFEVSTAEWSERADLDLSGQFKASRGVAHVYAFGKHLIGGDDGMLYSLDPTVYRNGSDPLVRERTSPHYATPGLFREFFSSFALDCTTGEAGQGIDPQAQLSYSDDSGASWGNPIFRSIGKVGQRLARVLWTRLGSGRDRVWKLRFSDNAPFSIINAFPISSVGKN